MQKSLDEKLARIHADPGGARDFILADAKDADMAFGIGAPGKSPEAYAGEARFRTLAEFRDIISQIVEQGLVDIMLMSASTSEALTIHKRLFDNSTVTPAARVNDTTDIHILRGAKYASHPSLPFRSATLDHIQCGRVECDEGERTLGANLGLYSITFNNDTLLDRQAIDEYKAFRLEAEAKGFRHFLEVFDPNVANAVPPDQLAGFINDAIVRTLAGVTAPGRPLFLKIVYHGPRALEELVRYDPHLVVGILGGAAGTTYDAFKLLTEAKKHGARVALFGRKINNAENQLAFIRFLRLLADGEIEAEEAVRAYHGVLQRLGIRPHRSLKDDLQLQTNVMSYGGNGKTISLPISREPKASAAAATRSPLSPVFGGERSGARGSCSCVTAEKKCDCDYPRLANGEPDFKKMTAAQKIAYHKAQWQRVLG